MERSTRLSILEHALADVVERLGEVPPSTDADALRALARQFGAEMALWEEHPPEESKRVALLKSVLDLNVQVIRVGARASRPDWDPADPDDDYPKAL